MRALSSRRAKSQKSYDSYRARQLIKVAAINQDLSKRMAELDTVLAAIDADKAAIVADIITGGELGMFSPNHIYNLLK